MVSRRSVLGAGASIVLGAHLSQERAWARRVSGFPFTLGVASGGPTPTGVTLWTRLAPSPLEVGGGMPHRQVPVRWQLADDEAFSRVVASGTVFARPEDAHSVHVDVTGLRSNRWYFYRFHSAGATSPLGRTRTLPPVSAAVSSLRLAVLNCQRFEHGYYSAYRHAASQDLDLVVHLGDYIYENVSSSGPRLSQIPLSQRVTTTDLESYRLRHALYRLDADLQAAHAAAPWVLIPDNHDAVEDGDATSELLARRTASYRAYYEHLPLPARSRPTGASMLIHQALDFGDLARLYLLDTRQHRDDQHVCGTQLTGTACGAIAASERTMLGQPQERWLGHELGSSDALWNAITQTVLFSPHDFAAGDDEAIYFASWDGYPAARARLLDDLATTGAQNPLILSGDWHTAWVTGVPANLGGVAGRPALPEFLTTSVSSDPEFTASRTRESLAENPQVRFFDDRCGYTLCTVARDSWQSEFLVADTATSKGAVTSIETWSLESGRPIAHRL